MSEPTKKSRKGTRSREVRIEAIESKQKYHADCIEKLEEQKQKLLNPQPRVSMKMSNRDKELLAAIKASGKTMDEVLAMINDQPA